MATLLPLVSLRCGGAPLASPSSQECEFSRRAAPSVLCTSSPAVNPTSPPMSRAAPLPRDCPLANDESSDFCFATAFAKLGVAGLAAAVLWSNAAPALAYKGGGPYGVEVTRGLDLSGKDFSGQTLVKQDFKASILRQANFKGAKLFGASFFDSDLTGADLRDADLRGADFSLANVAKANLTNANLEGALVTGNTSFRGAIITGADFTDVLWRDDQRVQLCKSAGGVNSTTGNATRETLLCE